MKIESVVNFDGSYITVRNEEHDEDRLLSIKLCGGVLDVSQGSKENLAKKIETAFKEWLKLNMP